ncbi:NAD-dependent epimerase/dehydratase family protein [Sphingobacterium griseoflavum]|uniref:NAD-dependent dehydratase n=1 Tax=Sphingobacterium griseoflavum TaxID=1474952 RepID=A0ABQ3I1S6_9SPHI|nr:NAD(P)-dependent oxidoreductase [Sphingobacterium griseoflavum]GHE46071.1 NAD-dependent dehydratase [Sphingobacterium griseoflavum]
MKKKILITGASGFVGSHLAQAAADAGHEVHAAVRKSSDLTAIKSCVRQFVYPNFDDMEELRNFFDTQRYDYVIHAAALTKAKSEKEMYAVNVGVTERLLHGAFHSVAPPQRFVFVSSLAAIGPVAYDAEITDEAPYSPITRYGRSKQAAEEMIKSKFSDKPITVVRPTAVYGPREKDLFILFRTMDKGLDAYIGRAPQKLSFVYVKDLAGLLLNACVAPQHGLTFFNITDGQTYSRYAMADIFKETFAKKLFRIHVSVGMVSKLAKLAQWLYRNSKQTPVIYPERIGELTAQNWSCDIARAKDILHYKPKYNLASGLRESLLWYKQNKWF